MRTYCQDHTSHGQKDTRGTTLHQAIQAAQDEATFAAAFLFPHSRIQLLEDLQG